MLTPGQIADYHARGFLHVPGVYAPDEMDALDADLDWLMDAWAATEMGWTGPWRQALMDPETEKKAQLTSLHDLHFYSVAWMRAATHPGLAEILADLLGPAVELHHLTLHAKPPETGHPFPLHQDNAFYGHTDGRYIDVLLHLDDTCHANGEIRFLEGSHRAGALPHITETAEGPCTPHLPTDEYSLADTEPVPARRGDVVLFNIFCVHGSHINTTDRVRRMVRMGYRDPANAQIDGQSLGRPGLMVAGRRLRQPEAVPFPTEGTAEAAPTA